MSSVVRMWLQRAARRLIRLFWSVSHHASSAAVLVILPLTEGDVTDGGVRLLVRDDGPAGEATGTSSGEEHSELELMGGACVNVMVGEVE